MIRYYRDERIHSDAKTAAYHNSIISKIFTLILIFGHIFSYYSVPIVSISLGSFTALILLPFAILFILAFSDKSTEWALLILAAYIVVRSKNDTFKMFLYAVSFTIVFSSSLGSVDIRFARRIIETVSVICFYILLIQTIFHYVFGINLKFVIYSLGVDGTMEAAGGGVKAGQELYRPSAFFLEPSHVTQFAIFGLISVLFPETDDKINVKKAILISAAILLTTSGMGIACVAGAWLSYMALGSNSKQVGKTAKRIAIGLLVGTIVFYVLLQLPFFSMAFGRVFGSDGTGEAFARFLYWDRYISPLSGISLLFGKGCKNLQDVYFTGIMVLIYSYGIIGVALFYAALFIRFKQVDLFTKISIVAYGAIMIIANMASYLAILYMLSLFYSVGSTVRR